LVFRLIELLIIALPVVGVVAAGMKALAAARGRTESEPGVPPAPGTGSRDSVVSRAIAEHDRTDMRWLEYELDIVRLLDFPMMTDMRDPLTERFHRAKLRADLLRPASAADLLGDRDLIAEYRSAVEDYVTAFDIAEAEAIRRRRSDFSSAQQQRMTRAQNLLRVAVDTAATPQEREHAYELARRELDGLMVLPDRTRAEIERGIAGELDR